MVPIPLPSPIVDAEGTSNDVFHPLAPDFLAYLFARDDVNSNAQTTAQAKASRHPFEDRVEKMKPSKSDINFVIMDYLVNEGYQAAAKKFAAEANIDQQTGDSEFIEERVEIRNAILSGDIQLAIEKLNDLNPDLLDLDTSLHFALLRLQLIELIRKCISDPNSDITPALTFAQQHLAPRAPTNPEFLSDLERTMALLIFPPENLTPPLAGLLDPALRQSIATKVNEAILTSQGHRSQARLKSLVRLRAWAERMARKQGKDLPERLDIWPEGYPASKSEDSVMTGNGGSEAMAL